MSTSDDDFVKQTVGIEEAARFLGFKSTRHVYVKVKQGLIPAFKVCRQLRFFKEELVRIARESQNAILSKAMRVDIIRGSKLCHSKKEVISGIRDFRSLELECKNLRTALRKKKPSDMKRNDAKR